MTSSAIGEIWLFRETVGWGSSNKTEQFVRVSVRHLTQKCMGKTDRTLLQTCVRKHVFSKQWELLTSPLGKHMADAHPAEVGCSILTAEGDISAWKTLEVGMLSTRNPAMSNSSVTSNCLPVPEAHCLPLGHPSATFVHSVSHSPPVVKLCRRTSAPRSGPSVEFEFCRNFTTSVLKQMSVGTTSTPPFPPFH